VNLPSVISRPLSPQNCSSHKNSMELNFESEFYMCAATQRPTHPLILPGRGVVCSLKLQSLHETDRFSAVRIIFGGFF
jgi:hypothetical protein